MIKPSIIVLTEDLLDRLVCRFRERKLCRLLRITLPEYIADWQRYDAEVSLLEDGICLAVIPVHSLVMPAPARI